MPAKQEVQTLLNLAITTAVTAQVTSQSSFHNGAVESLAVQANFVYGSGGTSADAYLQTSLDNGATWMDIANFHFTTASGIRYYNLTNAAVTSIGTPGDGALSGNTCVNGVLGSLYRVKYTTVGTYAGSTALTVTVVPVVPA